MAETKLRLTQTNLDAETNKLTSLADGTVASDAVNKGQLDTAVAGVVTEAKIKENEVPSGTIDGVNDTFTLAFTPVSDSSVKIYLNGQRLKITDDYTLAGDTITFVTPPKVVLSEPDKILVDYRTA